MEHSISTVNQRTTNPMEPFVTLIALGLLVAGGLNWAFVGLFDVDLVAAIFGPLSWESKALDILVGLAALYGLTFFPRLVRDAQV